MAAASPIVDAGYRILAPTSTPINPTNTTHRVIQAILIYRQVARVISPITAPIPGVFLPCIMSTAYANVPIMHGKTNVRIAMM